MPLSLTVKLAAVIVAKKATVYALAWSYGFPRVYRRLSELSRWKIKSRQHRKAIQDSMKYIIRIPNRIASLHSSKRLH
ncbi:uncharacterized protein [Dysidea avara]|uniref:uncharacterized protein n=1 Tax=Dysidea avara TaxID=196820 RepID=UPI003322D3B8